MSDLLAGLGSVLLDGPLLALLALVVLIVAFLAGIGYGRRSAFREIDAKRARVWAARRAKRLLPTQRDGSQ